MPAFSESNDRALLFLEGLFAPVEIDLPDAVSRLPRAPGARSFAPLFGKAMVDTGTRLTCVRDQALHDLGALKIGTTEADSPAGRIVQDVYFVSLALPNLEFRLDGQRVPAISMAAYPEDVIAIIGRDLLSRWTLTWKGPEGA